MAAHQATERCSEIQRLLCLDSLRLGSFILASVHFHGLMARPQGRKAEGNVS
jgi:hypothetical protein